MKTKKKRDKKYTPRPIGRPIFNAMRSDLVLPAYTAYETLRAGTDPESLEGARDTLAGFLNAYTVTAQRANYDDQIGVDALCDLARMIVRFEKTGIYRFTGPEMQSISTALVWVDELIKGLMTHQVAAACFEVERIQNQLETETA